MGRNVSNKQEVFCADGEILLRKSNFSSETCSCVTRRSPKLPFNLIPHAWDNTEI